MALADVVVALREQFKLRNCPAPILMGEQFNAEHAEPNRVVIIPTADTYGPKNPSISPRGTRNGFSNPRPIATRNQGCTVNLWAGAPTQADPTAQLDADYAALDSLINVFFASVNASVAGIFTIGAGENTVGQVANNHRGLRYQLQCVVAVPVLDIAWPAVAITDCTETYLHARVSADVDIDMTDGEETETLVSFTAPTPPDEA